MSKYIFQGNGNLWFVPTLDDQAAPSIAEIGGGTDLTNEVGEVTGFGHKSNYVDVPTPGSRFVPRIPGTLRADDSALMIYCKTEGDTLRATLPIDTMGYIVIRQGVAATEPIAEGDVVHVYPIIVSGLPFARPLGDTAATWMLEVAINGVPSEDVETTDAS